MILDSRWRGRMISLPMTLRIWHILFWWQPDTAEFKIKLQVSRLLIIYSHTKEFGGQKTELLFCFKTSWPLSGKFILRINELCPPVGLLLHNLSMCGIIVRPSLVNLSIFPVWSSGGKSFLTELQPQRLVFFFYSLLLKVTRRTAVFLAHKADTEQQEQQWRTEGCIEKEQWWKLPAVSYQGCRKGAGASFSG